MMYNVWLMDYGYGTIWYIAYRSIDQTISHLPIDHNAHNVPGKLKRFNVAQFIYL